jgi:hypothetical protein
MYLMSVPYIHMHSADVSQIHSPLYSEGRSRLGVEHNRSEGK